jgi:hypothetical protein
MTGAATLEREVVLDRYYDPSTSQFLAVDPLTDLTSAPYSYSNDNPVNETDPTGLAGEPGLPACSGAYMKLPKGVTEAEMCQAEQQNARHVVAQEEANQYNPKPLPPRAYASICGDFWIVKGCLSITGPGQLYLSFGYGFGTPGAEISAGTAGHCDARLLLGGWSNSKGAEYWVGGGYASSPNGAQGPYVSAGTPGFGSFNSYGWRLPW